MERLESNAVIVDVYEKCKSVYLLYTLILSSGLPRLRTNMVSDCCPLHTYCLMRLKGVLVFTLGKHSYGDEIVKLGLTNI